MRVFLNNVNLNKNSVGPFFESSHIHDKHYHLHPSPESSQFLDVLLSLHDFLEGEISLIEHGTRDLIA